MHDNKYAHITERQTNEGFHSDLLDELVISEMGPRARGVYSPYPRSYVWKRRAISIRLTLGLLCIVVLVMFALYRGLIVRSTIDETDVTAYDVYKEGHSWGHMWIFPLSIEEIEFVENYHYHYHYSLFGVSYQHYLECRLTQEAFEQEVYRLSHISGMSRHRILGDYPIVYDEENFKYPAYVSVFNYENSYEYALIDASENRIIYIYLEEVKVDDLVFEQAYLPHTYKDGTDNGRLNIYYGDVLN